MVKHAFLSFLRDRRKNLFMGLILTFFFFLLLNIGMIHTSLKSMIADYEDRLSYNVRLIPSYMPNKLTGQLTEEQYLQYGKSDLIEKMTLTAIVPVTLENLKTSDTQQPMVKVNQGEKGEIDYSTINQQNNSGILSASINGKKENKFSANSWELLKGSSKLALNDCLISEDLAKRNKLEIGSKIFVQLPKDNTFIREELVVAGIVKEKASLPTSEMEQYKQEELITNYDTLKKMQTSPNKYAIDAVYHLKKAGAFNQFKKELEKKELPAYYKVVSDKESASQMLSPFKSKEDITFTLLMSVFIFGMVLLLFFSTMFTKKRLSDLYTLMSFGMNKGKIFWFKFLEKFFLSVCCLLIALLASQVTQAVVSNSLMNWLNQLIAENFYLLASYNLPMTKVPLTLDTETLKIVATSLGLFLITSGISESYQIWTFNPTKFLLEGKSSE